MSPRYNSALLVSGIAVPRWSFVGRVRHANGFSRASFCSLFALCSDDRKTGSSRRDCISRTCHSLEGHDAAKLSVSLGHLIRSASLSPNSLWTAFTMYWPLSPNSGDTTLYFWWKPVSGKLHVAERRRCSQQLVYLDGRAQTSTNEPMWHFSNWVHERPAHAVAWDLIRDTPVGPGAQTHRPSSHLSTHVQPAGRPDTNQVCSRTCLPPCQALGIDRWARKVCPKPTYERAEARPLSLPLGVFNFLNDRAIQVYLLVLLLSCGDPFHVLRSLKTFVFQSHIFLL